jgi:hypothetical protein
MPTLRKRKYVEAFDNDWNCEEPYSNEDYGVSIAHNSDDKALTVGATRIARVTPNLYRQIQENEKGIVGLLGRIHRSEPDRILLFRTSGIVDARTRNKFYLTVKSQRGSPVQLVLPREVCPNSAVPARGDFVTYTVYKTSDGSLTHEITIAAPPQLTNLEEADIDARVAGLMF